MITLPVNRPPVTLRGSVVDTRYADELQARYETTGGEIIARLQRIFGRDYPATAGDRLWLNHATLRVLANRE